MVVGSLSERLPAVVNRLIFTMGCSTTPAERGGGGASLEVLTFLSNSVFIGPFLFLPSDPFPLLPPSL